MTRRRRTVAALAVLAVASGAAIYGIHLWGQYGERILPSERCTATLGEDANTLSAEQAGNAALIAAASARLGLPARAATIGIATAMQESSLINIDYGDRDSLGLFQQRPSQGWGTEDEILDPYYSSDTFFAALARVEGWEDMEVTVAAQTVQRSAFPDAYARREPGARLWASALRGYSGAAAVTCDVGEGDGTTAQEFAARVDRDFGEGRYEVSVLSATSEAIWLDVVPAGSDQVLAASFASWAVAVAADESIEAVANGDAGWDREQGAGVIDVPQPAAGIAVRLTPVDLTPEG
ncbi:hypothetical protein [Demequina sp.]|uniref:hypothetical protein n=1 Tax=Demequina sp. TaxID=2050685 RepID=UPI0025D996C2|nr:hypothetical protein [Demequina sp.]